ncbi:tyrosine-type recombinase/integrase [Kribbella sp. CA-293567]|uniref:tyrosine-type recombinase/integrase n=1 Tax=Kribbella sp. CA-293567 TaxID=3002436 RepID=UPI0022DD2B4E|nr:tyrosine-type recombinase/integrase [Kribbella sp. CA-293567]WBQ01888.1 tyrosine-type recombinase/integrase [Kribbella sp. CA-293567]
MHALRHYYASITLADGVNIKELAEYLGHGDPEYTLRLYTHMLPSSHERAREAADSRLSRLFSATAHGAVTEPRADGPRSTFGRLNPTQVLQPLE